ncbi:ligase-associated DNA damage response exonuclease [Leptospira ellisii]|uniref:DNA ligase-associated DEXH box helicase n=1 Tax=Leptospira ellisii TaxID=2023197 RepID=A0A2N0BAD8_9LEPT|nr:ligase-associated DNA damage response exonuclease [Leptospira ellisii]MDV6236195.1 ligase-associated DNA damage response exonuclease [Leptospira ellisii]PJZ93493.1 DNA ligase-associated DEXH box helicase [Leptospira ellisii]PKA05285.1 DNA ligase-associated DEXH box helicase [Leptospira ellisii]
MEMIVLTEAGLYVPQADVYIDPWKGVPRAILTHAHSDHTRKGSTHYLCAESGLPLTRERLGEKAPIETLPYGRSVYRNGVKLSLHSAGHILGSAQVRIEYKGRVAVVSGDYKTESDPTCDPIEILRCDTFLSEATFAKPHYVWEKSEFVFQNILNYLLENRTRDEITALFGYSLGKAQRLIRGVSDAARTRGIDVDFFVHDSIHSMNRRYEQSGIALPKTRRMGEIPDEPRTPFVFVAPPGSPIPNPQKKRIRTAFCSGWMRLSKNRKAGSFGKGFVLSDHADWNGLIGTILSTEADEILLTHGETKDIVRYLQERGKNAKTLETKFGSEEFELLS